MDNPFIPYISIDLSSLNVSAYTLENKQHHSVELIQLLPSDLKWGENSLLHGLQITTLLGNAEVAQPYVERTKIPAHFKIMPHLHPNPFRMVTVLSGTFYFAVGDEFDESKLQAFPAGSFFTEPENIPHYAMTKDEAVVLQLYAIGPTGTEFINN